MLSSCPPVLLVLILTAGVPAESLLVELYDDLGTLDVGLPGRHQVSLLTPLPGDEKHQLPRAVCGSDDPPCLQTSVKPCRRCLISEPPENSRPTSGLRLLTAPLITFVIQLEA